MRPQTAAVGSCSLLFLCVFFGCLGVWEGVGCSCHLAWQPSDALSLLRKTISKPVYVRAHTQIRCRHTNRPTVMAAGMWTGLPHTVWGDLNMERKRDGKSGGAAAERSEIWEKPSLKRPPPADTHTEQLCVINKHLICPQAVGSNGKKKKTRGTDKHTEGQILSLVL